MLIVFPVICARLLKITILGGGRGYYFLPVQLQCSTCPDKSGLTCPAQSLVNELRLEISVQEMHVEQRPLAVTSKY